MGGTKTGRGYLQQDRDGSQVVRLDEVKSIRQAKDGNFIYTGRAIELDADPAVACWQIMRQQFTGGIETLREFALAPSTPVGRPKQALYDRVWNDRTTYFTPSAPTGTLLDLPGDLQGQVNYVYQLNPIMNGGSKNMTVDGSVTPVDFTVVPATDETLEVESISFMIEDKGKMDGDAFGTIAGGLTNGLLISVQSEGVVTDLVNLQDNIDLVQAFGEGAGITPTGTGLFDTDDAYAGTIFFERPPMIKDADADFVRFRIRDNLSGVDFLRAYATVRRAVV